MSVKSDASAATIVGNMFFQRAGEHFYSALLVVTGGVAEE
jgi:hypothetical protein